MLLQMISLYIAEWLCQVLGLLIRLNQMRDLEGRDSRQDHEVPNENEANQAISWAMLLSRPIEWLQGFILLGR